MTLQYMAVISDQHIVEKGTTLYGLDTNTSAKHLFTDLAEARLPKLVLSLGDLADTTLNPVRTEAMASTEAYQNAQELALPLRRPFLTLPGNHDDPALLSTFFPNRWDYDTSGVSVRTFNHVDLIGVDVRTGPEATGLIAQGTLEQLDRVLEQSRKAILFTHFPVVDLDSPRINETLSVLNREELIPLFAKYREKILGVLSGHLHMRYATQVEGVVAHGVPSSAFMFRASPGSEDPISVCDDPCGYLLLGVDAEGALVVRQEYTRGAEMRGDG
jgi:Icc protein